MISSPWSMKCANKTHTTRVPAGPELGFSGFSDFLIFLSAPTGAFVMWLSL